MAAKKHVKEKSGWKKVDLDPKIYGDEEFGSLMSVEVLSDYKIIDGQIILGSEKSSKKSKGKGSPKKVDPVTNDNVKRKNKSKKEKDKKDKASEKFAGGKIRKSKKEKIISAKNLSKVLKKQKLGSILDSASVVDLNSIEKSDTITVKKKRKRGDVHPETEPQKREKRKKQATKESASETDTESDDEHRPKKKTKTLPDMSGWKDLFVPETVLSALQELGFTSPSPIQALVLPSAIRDRLDIVGAAETGSGKTLAFGIPVIHHILRLKEQQSAERERAAVLEEKEEEEEQVSDSDEAEQEQEPNSESEDCEDEDEPASDREDESEESSTSDDGTPEVVSMDKPEAHSVESNDHPRLYALVVTPTRELAIQVKNHLQAVAKYTGIKIATVVGGMSQQKQERLLKKHPEIVVATPGRLWELIQENNPHFLDLERLPLLVVDEADRMVEKGHYQELENLFEKIKGDGNQRNRRQNFIFSATLTYVHEAPNRLFLKKGKKKKKQKIKSFSAVEKLESLISQIGLKSKPKIIDLTKKVGTVETLTEARINCSKPEKDIYLYYFLNQFPGRTLIFVNSKDCLRRLISILTLLKCNPLPLHADMHQRQRLKNLDRFTGNPKAILLATDVAARGLDIPNVQHVLHYQVPYTTENYIHRSGRTARATKEGLSVMIVGPEDVKNYRKIIRSLNRDEELPLFPTDTEILPGIKARVDLARQIDVQEHRVKKVQHHNNWFKKAAEEMDIELDEDLLEDVGNNAAQKAKTTKLMQMKAELNSLIQSSLIPRTFSGKYPTKSGKLSLPAVQGSEQMDAVLKVKKDAIKDKKLIAKGSKPKVISTKKKRKFKEKKKR